MKIKIILSRIKGTTAVPFTVFGKNFFIPKNGDNPEILEIDVEKLSSIFKENGIIHDDYHKFAFNYDGYRTILIQTEKAFISEVIDYEKENKGSIYRLYVDDCRLDLRVIKSKEYLQRLGDTIKSFGPLD